jgi:hypothetical protein
LRYDGGETIWLFLLGGISKFLLIQKDLKQTFTSKISNFSNLSKKNKIVVLVSAHYSMLFMKLKFLENLIILWVAVSMVSMLKTFKNILGYALGIKRMISSLILSVAIVISGKP